MPTKKQGGNQLSSVRNALRILRSFSMDEPEKKVSDLSQSLGINKSTVSRTMATLANEGFVFKDPETQKYRLGLSIVSLGGVVNSTMDIYKESMPVLNKLVETSGETSHISILDNYEVIYLQKVECNHPVRFLTHVGKRNPTYCTSSGKILLAYSNDDVTETIIQKGLQPFTKNTITDPQKLRQHLRQIRKNGYTFSIEEFTEGVNSVAAPVYNYKGQVVAALSVVGPKQRIYGDKLQRIAKQVMQASADVSSRLGYWN
ncbi:IclR family transcriptional regulator [Bacillus sp. FJAT-50079]|uniref:IclR family transcriptional regulator n=1 Tax=Bacillus sp. FJAT-50079 TaxID=2833577 RepID=UPI0020161EE3|nr:IclR family transcriptional regulator [Bacillus sp. FJAT-50079]